MTTGGQGDRNDAGARWLIVLLHCYNGEAADMATVERTAVDALTDTGIDPADIETWRPELPLHLASTADPNMVAYGLAIELDRRWRAKLASGQQIDRIVLVGYSLGGLLARKAYVIACGETPDAPFEPEIPRQAPLAWAGAVERIILLAGMNRGWRVTHHLGVGQAILWSFGRLAGRVFEIFSRRRLLITRIHRGADFITQLRIQWLRMRHCASRQPDNAGRAPIIQLLGSVDDMVSPADNIDLVSGGDFTYLDIPYSGHVNVIQMEDLTVAPGEVQTIGQLRRNIFILAMTGTKEALKTAEVIPDDRSAVGIADPSVTDVVFVIHGIRDGGYWTHKVARAIRKRAVGTDRKFATETSSYGYFPILPFLFTRGRQANVEWLMDQYAEAVALYPNAMFHFVGHSNGTWCLAKALESYPCCRFRRVVFAGSVVRSGFDWSRMLAPPADMRPRHGQVEAVLNFVATADFVVAFFPKFFEVSLPIQDLGGAGHDGFAMASGGLVNVQYVTGGHGAAIQEPVWDAIADFVLTGDHVKARPPTPLFSRTPDGLVTWLGRRPIVVWAALLMAIAGVGQGLAWAGHQSGLPEWGVTLLLVGYALALWRLANWI